MKIAALLTLLLSQGGYWFGGQDEHLIVRREVQGPAASVVMEWHLLLAETEVGGGKVPFELTDKPAAVLIHTPTVRERTELSLRYSIRSKKGDAVLQTGHVPVHLFPARLVTDRASAAAGKHFVVLDDASQVSDFLRLAKLKPTVVDKPSRVALLDPDILIVGPQHWSRAVDDAMMALVRNGCGVLVLAQPAGSHVHEWSLSARPAVSDFIWDSAHPLFRDLDTADLQSLAARGGDTLVGIQVPADAAALTLASWPREAPAGRDDAATPSDALVVTQTLGRGRLLLCQLPLTDWSSDPRSQILLNNALDYLLTRPEPTPRPSDRVVPAPPAATHPENRIPLKE